MKKLHLIIFTAVISIIISWFLYKIYVWNKIGGKNTSEIEGVK